MHWVSPELSDKKRERLTEKASCAPELVVVEPLNAKWKCHRCGGAGDLLMMEDPGPARLRCVGLDALEYLPAADALLTRRAKAKSAHMLSWCVSAGPAAATSARVCWSSGGPWRTRSDA